MKVFKSFLILCLASIALMFTSLVTSGPPAPEYDVKSYPGIACQASPSGIAVFHSGYICNPVDSTVGLWLYCPIVRDDVMGDDGTYELEVDVVQNGPLPVGCMATSWLRGENIESVSDVGAVIGEETLNLDLNESVPEGYYSMWCWLHADSCVYSYRVYEWQDGSREMTDYNR